MDATNISIENNSGQGKDSTVPDEIKGWSWGGFLLSWIWAIGNNTWLGLLSLIPYVGFVMSIILGIKGRKWAWQNKKWESIEHFKKTQRKWSVWSIVIIIFIYIIMILASLIMPFFLKILKEASV